ncbi:HNH endonuclease [Microbacterium sp. LRZ72]|uniref:HNH endonuclease signature motif containing protein n=1 Tax=Microbacterium sp. LRZ72 TaxID=2942481 RepID=UPI0029A97B30|nr:DUF222 domain-containing protein [Microbacterium sp. LRZ72]MDX2375576.1 HNH endonuclease [Microbacterium sp. LRZ72]
MNDTRTALEGISDAARDVAGAVLRDGAIGELDDDALLELAATAAGLVRSAEALLIEAAGEVRTRSDSPMRSERLSTRMGCGSVPELLERATRVCRHRANDLLRAATSTRCSVSPVTGQKLPADFPGMRAALADGAVGLDAILAVAGVLASALPRAGRDAITAADKELANAARGAGADAAPPATSEDLRMMAQVWSLVLDPDGAEPREAAIARRRGITVGRPRHGVIPIRGNLLPEVAGQFQQLCDSILNPRNDGPRFTPDADDHRAADAEDESAIGDAPSPVPTETRTGPQRRHDALATILTAAAASGTLPVLGSAAPTLVVSVRESDLATGRGWAHVHGTPEPVSIAAARHAACTGSVTRVVNDDTGRIISITSHERIFTHHQRRAIALRDGGCLIPGCHVPSTWCEVHHVDEHARGGPTHTDNGVLLCWHHHRTLDTSGWAIRMAHGIPEIRGPSWWDPHSRWRPATSSLIRIRDRITAH